MGNEKRQLERVAERLEAEYREALLYAIRYGRGWEEAERLYRWRQQVLAALDGAHQERAPVAA